MQFRIAVLNHQKAMDRWERRLFILLFARLSHHRVMWLPWGHGLSTIGGAAKGRWLSEPFSTRGGYERKRQAGSRVE